MKGYSIMWLPPQAGPYEIRGVLGAGGFATVYHAYHLEWDRELALKVLHPHLAYNPAFRERFVREGKSLARVRHHNLVQLYDAGELADGSPYLAMELIAGRTLQDILAHHGPRPLDEVVDIAEQAAAALAAVHAVGIIHRDVKPDNIFIEATSGRAVLLDLGGARVTDATTITAPGQLIGTLPFMAPEQVRDGRQVTPQTDVYQLGATVFTLLTGRTPFMAASHVALLFAIIHQTPPDLTTLRTDVPLSVAEIINNAMAKQALARPVGPSAFATQLRAAVNAHSSFNRALTLPHQSDYDWAIADYSVAVPPQPNNAQYYTNRGGLRHTLRLGRSPA